MRYLVLFILAFAAGFMSDFVILGAIGLFWHPILKDVIPASTGTGLGIGLALTLQELLRL